MRSSWFFRPRPGSGAKQALWVVFGLIVVMFYFTRRVLTSLRVGGWVDDVDAPVHHWVLQHQEPWALNLAGILHVWGSTPGMTITMIILVTLLCWWTRSFWPLLTIAFTALGSVLLTIILKRVLQVPRPVGVPGGPAPPETYSFPSGHTLNATALIGMAAYLAVVYGLRRYAYLLGGIAGIFALSMAASRIYLAHHWVSDVVVGLVIGAAWGAVVATLHFYFVPRTNPVRTRP